MAAALELYHRDGARTCRAPKNSERKPKSCTTKRTISGTPTSACLYVLRALELEVEADALERHDAATLPLCMIARQKREGEHESENRAALPA